MNLRHMEVFRAVMLTGSVNGAAELLHVSQPAISKMLAQAARLSGLALFERVKGRLMPTPEAHTLYTEIETAWRSVERVKELSRSLVNPEAGTLRLAVTASIAPYLAPQAVARLYEQFPSLQVHVEILVAPIMVDALLDHSADVGVAVLPNEHPNLVTVKKYDCGLVCVMRKDHPLARKRGIRPADLADHRVISSSASTPYGQSLRRAYGEAAGRLKLDLEVRSSTAACWFAQSGAGIALVDTAAVAGTSFSGLAVKPFVNEERLEVRVIRNRYRPMSVVQQHFCTAFDKVWRTAFPRRR
ncbi:LysR substrate-binding domain-containing protein [Variovorax sp. J2P1-59]|uniref:LysR substrate-binding domain-containing protein n=1 Tax=Variovorax flavidus TaxID=3053501 RepID=UPI00257779EF|nr:LysR substrate-binding domain-containing protein [Variovorax sp. J2P1-59]MDM0078793.1 LysR substrate-binding domain-containing protein [Variovorax sp. J2P1-59]